MQVQGVNICTLAAHCQDLRKIFQKEMKKKYNLKLEYPPSWPHLLDCLIYDLIHGKITVYTVLKRSLQRYMPQ